MLRRILVTLALVVAAVAGAGMSAVPAAASAPGAPLPAASGPAQAPGPANAPTTLRHPCAGPCRSSTGAAPAQAIPAPGPTLQPGPGALPATTAAAGTWGFDMNGNGCNGSSWLSGAAPQGVSGAAHLGFDSVQLNGWGWADMYFDDPCFATQVQWYQQNDAGNPIQFIMFPVPYDNNYCSSYSTSPSDGHTAGSGQAQMIYQKAKSAGLPVQGGVWWLDVEQTTDCGGWNFSLSQINLGVIQGAVDYLRGQGLTVGIYTDYYDWNHITNWNHSQFADVLAWNADIYNYQSPHVTIYNNSQQNPYDWTSTVLAWAKQECGVGGITGGPLYADQYMWGNYSNSYPNGNFTTDLSPAILGRDFDYECQGSPSGPPSISSLSGSGAMASTLTISGTNFGSSQGSSYVHLWFTPDNPHACATDATTINWGVPGNWAAFTVQGWSAGSVSIQVPTPSGPDRQSGSTLGSNLWMIPAGDTGCVAVTTSGGTSNTASFTAQGPATQTYASSGWTVGFDGPGLYGLGGNNIGSGGRAVLVCSDDGGQSILDQQGYQYPVWDLVDEAGFFFWVWDGMITTPAGGLSLHCSSYPAANPVPASINAIAGVAGFQMGQAMDVFGAGFGASQGSGYVHLWTDNAPGGGNADCGNGSTTSINWGEPGNAAAFTLDSWADTRVVFQVPTPSGPGQVGSQWQIVPGNWGCVTVFNSSGGSTIYGQYAIFVEQAPLTQTFTTSGAANIRSGPSTSDPVQWTASAGESLTLICFDPNGQSVGGYATWDQLSNGQWVWDGLMNTPPGGPSGLPHCATFPPNL